MHERTSARRLAAVEAASEKRSDPEPSSDRDLGLELGIAGLEQLQLAEVAARRARRATRAREALLEVGGGIAERAAIVGVDRAEGVEHVGQAVARDLIGVEVRVVVGEVGREHGGGRRARAGDAGDTRAQSGHDEEGCERPAHVRSVAAGCGSAMLAACRSGWRSSRRAREPPPRR
jgi:hypothetical protein